ncbi:alginate lyase family protein [Runella sp.]|uniref:alginate lyase family protein n=1 Tax=Runella sp. TaxID=1960881 RepID=UPI003D0DC4D9
MKHFLTIILSLAVSVSGMCQQVSELVLMDGKTLAQNKKRIASGDTALATAYKKLILEADRLAKKEEVYSVMHKTQSPPSGDKHDYMSQAPYWWPDPAKPDGKPYIRKDGDRNPEINGITDHDQLGELISETEILSLAYFYTGKDQYAQRTAQLIKAWFLDEKTKMNPHLNFGQGIPGINTGRGIGIIETRELGKVCDATTLISTSKYWDSNAQKQFKAWIGAYDNWLVTSAVGKDEADEHNNHGTYYSVQVVAFSLFTGNTSLAKSQLDTAKVRLQKQLQPDGSQPHELARTLPYNYATMNLRGFFELATMAKKLNIDLWNYQTSDGKSLKKAFDWFSPYVTGEKKWEYKQLKSPVQDQMVILLKMASKAYQRPEFDKWGYKVSPKEYAEATAQLKY